MMVAARDKADEGDLAFIRLYILCCAQKKSISSRDVWELLVNRGVPATVGSLSQLARGLENDGYLQSGEIGTGRQRQTIYRATFRGRAVIEHARVKIRNLPEAQP